MKVYDLNCIYLYHTKKTNVSTGNPYKWIIIKNNFLFIKTYERFRNYIEI